MNNNKSVYQNDQHYDKEVSSIFVMIMALIIIFTTTNDIYIEQLSLTIDSFIFKELEILFVVATTLSIYNDDDLYFLERMIYICWPIALYFEFVLLEDCFSIGIILLIIMILSVISQLFEWLSHTTKETFWDGFDYFISGITMSTFCLSVIAFGCDIGFNTYHAIINDAPYQQQTKEYREFFDELEEVFLGDSRVEEQYICYEDVNVRIEVE